MFSIFTYCRKCNLLLKFCIPSTYFLVSFLQWFSSIWIILLLSHFFFFCVQILFIFFFYNVCIPTYSSLQLQPFSPCFIFSWMIFLNSSFHHSFLRDFDLPCVCITSLAASTIAIFVCSHSSSVSCFGAKFTNLLHNSDLYSSSFDGFCKFILFHFSVGFNFFLHITLNFCLITALTKKWSESILGPLIDLTSSVTPFLFAFIIIWSVWLAVFWSGDSHFILCIILLYYYYYYLYYLCMQTHIIVHHFYLFLPVRYVDQSLHYIIFLFLVEHLHNLKLLLCHFLVFCPAGTVNYHKTVL